MRLDKPQPGWKPAQGKRLEDEMPRPEGDSVRAPTQEEQGCTKERTRVGTVTPSSPRPAPTLLGDCPSSQARWDSSVLGTADQNKWGLVAFPFKTPLAWGVLVPPASGGADGKRDRARNQERSMASSTYREGMMDLWGSAGRAGLSGISRAAPYVEAVCIGGQRPTKCPTIKGPATNNQKPTHT